MRHTISTVAIASATFAATLAFAPAMVSVGKTMDLSQIFSTETSSPASEAPRQHCHSILSEIVVALGGKDCA